MNTLKLIDTLWQDVRYGLRQLRLNPGFTLIALASLALGIGANSGIFQLLDAVRLRSLPVKNPYELAEVKIEGGNGGWGVNPGWPNEATYPLWEQLRDHQQAYSGIFAWGVGESEVGEREQKRRVRSLWVTGAAFPTLGVAAQRGRLLAETDDRPGCDSSAVAISHGFWQREFAGQDSAVGARLMVDGRPVTVLGVTPLEFFGLEVGKGFDIAMPACTRWTQRRDVWWLSIMGRLKPDWTLARAAAHLRVASPGLFEAVAPTGYDAKSMEKWRKFRLTAAPAGKGISRLRADYERSLWLLLGITGLILLIACANLANLLLARATAREREIAVRLAIGASRARLISQMLTESLVLGASGAVAGVLPANLLSRGLLWFLSTGTGSFQLDLAMDWTVLGFTAAAAMATTIAFGLVPAVRSTRVGVADAMKSARGTTTGLAGVSFQRLLIVSQVSVSLVLLVAALLFVRSYRKMIAFDPGFRQEGIFTASLTLDHLHLPDDRRQRFKQELTDAVKAVPRVEAAAMSTHTPLSDNSWSLGVQVPNSSSEQSGSSKFTWISPGYLATMRIPILAGRDFDSRDTAPSGKVLIVNETFVRRFLGDRNPIGATVRSVAEPGFPAAIYEVVGVVRDTKYRSLREVVPPIAYSPGTAGDIFVRTSAPMPDVITAVRAVLQKAVPGTTIEIQVLREQVLKGFVRERVLAWLSGFFGLLAGALALAGLYGVITYMVARRKNEIGIRLALGETRPGIIVLVLRDVAAMLMIGIAIGSLISLTASRGARSLLFDLEPNDPLTLALSCGALVIIAVAAASLPAWRASRLDPVTALRNE